MPQESDITDVETELRKMIPHLRGPAPDASKVIELAADIVASAGQVESKLRETERERDVARRIAETYRRVWETCSAAVDTCPNHDPLPWDPSNPLMRQ